MIQYIRGELAALEEDRIIVDVGGVGYGIFMSVQSMSAYSYLFECEGRCNAIIWFSHKRRSGGI